MASITAAMLALLDMPMVLQAVPIRDAIATTKRLVRRTLVHGWFGEIFHDLPKRFPDSHVNQRC